MTGFPLEVLLVEDDEADVDLTREALKDAKIALTLNVVDDGEKAMAYLRRGKPYQKARRPDLIILDLNLPRKDGREVLAEVKADPGLRSIPVVVVTSSDAEADVLRSYDLGANCYVTKPLGLDQFLQLVRDIEEFWLTIVRLPRQSAYPSTLL